MSHHHRPPIPKSGTLITTPLLYIARTQTKGLGLFTTHAIPANSILLLEPPLLYIPNAQISSLTPASVAAEETWLPLYQYLNGIVPDALTTKVSELPFSKRFDFYELGWGVWKGTTERSIVWANGWDVEGVTGTVVGNRSCRVNHSCMPNARLSWCTAEEVEDACQRNEEGDESDLGMMSGGLVDEGAVPGPSQHFDDLVTDAPKERMGRLMLWNHEPLRQGEEVTIGYGYAVDELKSLYGFDCACLVCTSQWRPSGTTREVPSHRDKDKDLPPPPYESSANSIYESVGASRTQSCDRLARQRSKGSGIGNLEDEETGGSVYLSCEEPDTSRSDLPLRIPADIFKPSEMDPSSSDSSFVEIEIEIGKSPEPFSSPNNSNSSQHDLLEAKQVNLKKVDNETLRVVNMSKTPTNIHSETEDVFMSQNTADISFQTEDYDLSQITEADVFPSSPATFSKAKANLHKDLPSSPPTHTNNHRSETTNNTSPQRDPTHNLSRIMEESTILSSPHRGIPPTKPATTPSPPIPPKSPLRRSLSLSPQTWVRARTTPIEPPLPPLRSPETLGTLIQIQDSKKHRGFGIFALQHLPTGTLVLHESPLLKLKYPTSSYRAIKHLIPDPLDALVDNLPPAHRSAFQSLHSHTHPTMRAPVYREIIWTNAFTVDAGATAVFEATCRINHACAPNCRWHWKPADRSLGEEEGHMMVWATREIAEGEELTIDYGCTGRELESKYGFRCACEICELSKTLSYEGVGDGSSMSAGVHSGGFSEGGSPVPPPLTTTRRIPRTGSPRPPLSSNPSSILSFPNALSSLLQTASPSTQTSSTFLTPFAPKTTLTLPRRHPETLNTLLSIRPSPLGGLGLFALQPIQSGRLILNESPLISYTTSGDLSALTTTISSLSAEDIELIYALSPTSNPLQTTLNTNPEILPQILHKNAFLRLDGAKKGLFEAACRINHSCVPNSSWVWGQRMLVRAKRAIGVGEEVTISYGLESGERMWREYGFVCECGRGCVNEGRKVEGEGGEEDDEDEDGDEDGEGDGEGGFF
ncbi:hypothetical protein HYFRA_00003283 [Hymenoscyphus fraxineus]|uniref:SET domain-containing protein n=1 Tax=Hymenoscyphus fraxineus TaxID=746836 RepID=A0A9N9KUF0_9HELO|nr:hypothetical protein HYFRA_00003283 [Hymenoscyphus fraxineus]